MWTSNAVKMRFLEAADIEWRMYVKSSFGGGNGWPLYIYDAEDRAGWDDAARLDALEKWQGRKHAGSEELSRWEETYFLWTGLIAERHRLLVWRYAQCLASGRSFSKYCETKGIVRRTAYDRVERVFENLASVFSKEARFFREPAGKWALQEDRFERGMDIGSVSCVSAKTALHSPFRAEPHHDMLTTPAAVAAFSQHLAESNDKRRKARLRKALRGVPGEQEAA